MAKLRHIWLMDRYTYSTVGLNMLSVHVQALPGIQYSPQEENMHLVTRCSNNMPLIGSVLHLEL